MEPNSVRVLLGRKISGWGGKIKNYRLRWRVAGLLALILLLAFGVGGSWKKLTSRKQAESPASEPGANASFGNLKTKPVWMQQWEILQAGGKNVWIQLSGIATAPPKLGPGKVIKVPEIFPTIQAAIDSAVAGDVVLVGAGEFKENLIMKNGVSVVGAGADKSILDGERKGATVYFKDTPDKNTRIENFTIKNASPGLAGVLIEDASPTVNRNEITNNDYGIYVKGKSSPILQRNRVSLSKVGVQVFNLTPVAGAKTIILDNRVFRNQKGVGIYNAEALVEHNTLSFNNSYTENGEATFGVYIVGSKTQLLNNLITENGLCELCAGIFADEKSQEVRIAFNNIWDNHNNFVCFGDCTMENNNFSEDPQFVGVENLELKESSPFWKAGSGGHKLGARL